jgi:hypothetical protein
MKTKFDFALNLRTVKALGIMFPSGVVGSFVAVHESTAALWFALAFSNYTSYRAFHIKWLRRDSQPNIASRNGARGWRVRALAAAIPPRSHAIQWLLAARWPRRFFPIS